MSDVTGKSLRCCLKIDSYGAWIMADSGFYSPKSRIKIGLKFSAFQAQVPPPLSFQVFFFL